MITDDMNEGAFIEDDSLSLDDVESYYDEEPGIQRIADFVVERYNKAEDSRRTDEDRWLRAYRNYRGIYGPDVQFTDAEKSRVFIKVTKTKVLAAYGQITDVLFANQRFPLSVNPTRLPDGVAEAVHFDAQNPQQPAPPESPYGYEGDGSELPPGATLEELMGVYKNKLAEVEDVKLGVGQKPNSVNFYPAMVAAKKMEKKIMDQLEESNASKQLRSTAFEMPLFGHGIMKGPFAEDKEYPNWDEEGEYNPMYKTVPRTSHVSL